MTIQVRSDGAQLGVFEVVRRGQRPNICGGKNQQYLLTDLKGSAKKRGVRNNCKDLGPEQTERLSDCSPTWERQQEKRFGGVR